MRFLVSTGLLRDALDLMVISDNVSKLFEKSTIVELHVEGDSMRMNTQASSILSECELEGIVEDRSGVDGIIVDAVLFKSLISSFARVDSAISLTFGDDCLTVDKGMSKFHVPRLLADEDEISLDRPDADAIVDRGYRPLYKSVISDLREFQMFAVSDTNINMTYNHILFGDDGCVITGDPQLSIFTYQAPMDTVDSRLFDDRCLLSTNIVNLLAAMKPGSNMYRIDDCNYVVTMEDRCFKMISQFKVDHEGVDGLGDYASDKITDMALSDDGHEFEISKQSICGMLKQASLFSHQFDPYVSLEANADGIRLVNDSIDCRIGDSSALEYKIGFAISDLHTVLSHACGEHIFASPILRDGMVIGMRLKSGEITSLIGGIE